MFFNSSDHLMFVCVVLVLVLLLISPLITFPCVFKGLFVTAVVHISSVTFGRTKTRVSSGSTLLLDLVNVPRREDLHGTFWFKCLFFCSLSAWSCCQNVNFQPLCCCQDLKPADKVFLTSQLVTLYWIYFVPP